MMTKAMMNDHGDQCLMGKEIHVAGANMARGKEMRIEECAHEPRVNRHARLKVVVVTTMMVEMEMESAWSGAG